MDRRAAIAGLIALAIAVGGATLWRVGAAVEEEIEELAAPKRPDPALGDTEHVPIPFETVRAYADRAEAVYYAPEMVRGRYEDRGVFHFFDIPDVGVAAFTHVPPDETYQWIVVRGTANLDNVLVDLEFAEAEDHRLGIPVHEGFDQSAQELYAAIQPKLRRDLPIRLSGHSLGGAIAVLLTMDLHRDGYPIEHCMTFGQPKVTTSLGVEKYRDLPIMRVVHEEDPIPLGPPETFFFEDFGAYAHLGTELWIGDDGSFAYFDEHQAERSELSSMWSHVLSQRPADHGIESYIRAIDLQIPE